MPLFSRCLGLAVALSLYASNIAATQLSSPPLSLFPAFVSGTFQVSITPTTGNDLSNLYFLFDSGDVQTAYYLGASAPANVISTFSVTANSPAAFPNCGPFFSAAACGPYVGVVAVNTDETPNGIDVGLDPAQALTVIGSQFSDPGCSGSPSPAAAFPTFCFFASPDSAAAEATLLGALDNSTSTFLGGYTGGQVVGFFAADAQPLLALFNTATDTAALSLVTFSDGTHGGSVSVQFNSAPEPGMFTSVAAGLLALGLRRRRAGR